MHAASCLCTQQKPHAKEGPLSLFMNGWGGRTNIPFRLFSRRAAQKVGGGGYLWSIFSPFSNNFLLLSPFSFLPSPNFVLIFLSLLLYSTFSPLGKLGGGEKEKIGEIGSIVLRNWKKGKMRSEKMQAEYWAILQLSSSSQSDARKFSTKRIFYPEGSFLN